MKVCAGARAPCSKGFWEDYPLCLGSDKCAHALFGATFHVLHPVQCFLDSAYLSK